MTFVAILPNHLLAKDGKDEEDKFVQSKWWGSPKDVDELVINIDVREPIASDKRRGSMAFSHASLNCWVLQN